MLRNKRMAGVIPITIILSAFIMVLFSSGFVRAESASDNSNSTNLKNGWGLILDAGIKGTYESNLNGALADINKKGDFYTTLSAGIGAYKQIAPKTYIFGRVDGLGSIYSKYSSLNVAAGGIGIGVRRNLNDVFSAEAALKASVRSFQDSPRDSSAYGGNIVITEQINPKWWIKEGYEYESNNASSNLFSYSGNQLGIWTGYLISPRTMINFGYSYLTRKYDDPSGFTTNTNTISVGIVRQLAKKFYINAGYDHQFNNSNIQNYNDNIYTAGLTYSY